LLFDGIENAGSLYAGRIDFNWDFPSYDGEVPPLDTVNYHVFCSIVVYPVIPKGDIIYRLIPTASHTDEDIDITLKAFEATKKKLDAGEYKATDIPDMADVSA
jgi:hypothetical protein